MQRKTVSCPMIGQSVIVTRQRVSGVGGIGFSSPWSQYDYQCGNENGCEHRGGRGCYVWHRNNDVPLGDRSDV